MNKGIYHKLEWYLDLHSVKNKHMIRIFLRIMAKERSLISLITFVNTLNNALGHTDNLFVYVLYLVSIEKYTYVCKYFTVSSNM